MTERIVEFSCQGSRMFAVNHTPAKPAGQCLIVIGKTCTDRQAVLLARAACEAGISVFRFDFRGRGICEGPLVTVEETRPDLESAVDAAQSANPHAREFAIWGLSEGAASALLYAHLDTRVNQVLLVNPWIRMEQAVAGQRLKSKLAGMRSRDFWHRIRYSEAGYLGAARSLWRLSAGALVPRPEPGTLKDRVMEGLTLFQGAVTIILSCGDPATAVFQAVAKPRLEQLMTQGRLTLHTLADADHVFSRSDWRQQLIRWTIEDALALKSHQPV